MSNSILVVDDNETIRRLCRIALERDGYEVSTAGGGAEALELAQAGHPDLILMDVEMSGGNGIETTRRLRADARTSDIPVVGFSGYSTRENVTRMREAGATSFVVKGDGGIRELLARLRGLIASPAPRD